jgi:hypothetical protein
MGALNLTPREAVIFAATMAIALGLLFYAGWLIGLERQVSPLPPAPDRPAPDALSLTACASPGHAARPAVEDIFPVDRFRVGAGDVQWLAYLDRDRTLLVGGSSDEGNSMASFTLFGDQSGTHAVPTVGAGRLADVRAWSAHLSALDGSGARVHTLTLGPDLSEGVVSGGIDLRAAAGSRISGFDIDEATASIVLVDPSAERLLRLPYRFLPRSEEPVWDVASACATPLRVLRGADDILIAVRPSDRALLVAEEGGDAIFRLDATGTPVASYDLSSAGIEGIRGLAFAPSADPRDPEGSQHLYILGDRASRVTVVTFEPPAPGPIEVPSVAATEVRSIDLAALDPPSSDPGGVAFDRSAQRVIVTDSDIDELAAFSGSIVFSYGWDGGWEGLGVPAELHEVSDVAVDVATHRRFFTDDGLPQLVVFDLGPDATFGTHDDRATGISTTTFGNDDPEGVAYGQASLFITDGAGASVHRLSPGEDGEFAGISELSDDSVTSFDTRGLGITDPEGVAFDADRGTLYVLSRDRREPIIEVGTDGRLLRRITLPEGLLVSPGGIAMLPEAPSGNLRLMIADRGADNARSSNANDGRLVEIELPPPEPRD